MKWCSTYLYRSIQKRRARELAKITEEALSSYVPEYFFVPTENQIEYSKHIPLREIQLEDLDMYADDITVKYESEEKH